MDNQITEIEQAIASEITVDSEGHGFITGRGLARLLGINHTAILRGERFPSKLVETLTQQGIDPGERPFSEVALTLIAEHYAYHAQRTTEQARQVYRTLAAIGARTWMQKVTGWTPEPVQPPQPALPPGDVRVANLINALDRLGFDMENPRFNQQLKDITGDILGLTPDRQLPGTVEEERWCGVAERAEELGYGVKQVASLRSMLGKWVKKHYPGDPRQEKRLCNGTQRLVYIYRVGPALDTCIEEFMKIYKKFL